MLKIFKYSFFDMMRSRWSYIYFLFFLLAATGLLYLSTDLSKAIVSLMNIILILVPLIGTLFGVMHYFNSREFVELLLAQPIKRTNIFLGQYLGLTASLALSLVAGLGIPFLIYGIHVSGEVFNFLILLGVGVFLTFIFTALAFWIALKNENKIKGFGIALLLWLFMAMLYDGVLLLSMIMFEHYPMEKFAIGATVFNPIDLSRILIMLKLDISALMGYTGAVFNKFFGTSQGMVISVAALVVWVVLPILAFLRVSVRKDF